MKRFSAQPLILLIAAGLVLSFGVQGCTTPPEPVQEGSEYAAFPFPTAGNYATQPMLPSNIDKAALDTKIFLAFKNVLDNDLIFDANAPKSADAYRIVTRHYKAWEVEEEEIEFSSLSVSESQGYGMMMLAYMAGSEPRLDAVGYDWIYDSASLQDYYDGMLRAVQAFPSVTGNLMMAWEIWGNGRDDENQTGYEEIDGVKVAPFSVDPEDGDSATDGDMDIIYSLILADKQWGSDGSYNYLQIAIDMLADLWDYCVHDEYHTLLLGDWAKGLDEDESELLDATRSSDFILDHLKVYAAVDPAHDWNSVLEATLGVIKDVREAEIAAGHDNGLLPDFIIRDGNKWVVPEGEVLEDEDLDGAHGYNACRNPWRLGTYYLLYGDVALGSGSLESYVIKPMDTFARNFAKAEGLAAFGPFTLDGELFDWDDQETFVIPFLVTAAAAAADQAWVDQLWGYPGFMLYQEDDYSDFYKVHAMLAAAGYFWSPLETDNEPGAVE